ncbi:neuropeptide FF receptor 2-like [Branchiostoma floridae]|uniref:Neuropeptide FF receptor 2-like n=1 Tax=Branchiostoma floridae TaxID=7739 RepID=A0A9J7HU94_BRAFL|nr:neuropeptide FF receptor 2-like [Branchiostoma floridae]
MANLTSDTMYNEGNGSDIFLTPIPLYKHDTPVTIVFIISYLIIFLMCIVGNVGVCTVLVKNPKMRTVTNLFILNLAISDLLVAVFCMPFTLVDNLLHGNPFGDVICKLQPLVQGISVGASIFSLTAIAVDRFQVIINPRKPKMSRCRSVQIITAIWVFSALIMWPQALVIENKEEVLPGYQNQTMQFCDEQWPSVEYNQAYTVMLFIVIYIGPLLINVYLYIRISFRIWYKPNPAMASSRSSKMSNLTQVSKKRVRVIKMLITVLVLFAVCWLPIHACLLIDSFKRHKMTIWQRSFLYAYMFPIAHWLLYFNSSINPIVYGYFNTNFRRSFESLCGAAFPLEDSGGTSGKELRGNGRPASGRTYKVKIEMASTGNGLTRSLRTVQRDSRRRKFSPPSNMNGITGSNEAVEEMSQENEIVNMTETRM